MWVEERESGEGGEVNLNSAWIYRGNLRVSLVVWNLTHQPHTHRLVVAKLKKVYGLLDKKLFVNPTIEHLFITKQSSPNNSLKRRRTGLLI